MLALGFPVCIVAYHSMPSNGILPLRVHCLTHMTVYLHFLSPILGAVAALHFISTSVLNPTIHCDYCYFK